MDKEHSFSVRVAEQYGVYAAIILKNLAFWIEKNIANGKHCHDGRTWTYNSYRAWSELFPYLSAKQLRTTLNKLVENGILLKGNFNKSAYDRTNWYAFVNENKWVKSLSPSGQVQGTGGKSPLPQTAPPIPDSKQIENTDSIIAKSPAELLAARQADFKKSLNPFIPTYGQSMVERFFDYWTEPNKSKTKFKQELQQTWDTARRLRTWSDNESRRSAKSHLPKHVTDGRHLTNMFNDAITTGY